MVGGGIFAPMESANPVVRFVTKRLRGSPEDFSPWQGLIYECIGEGPHLRTLESLRQGDRASVRLMNIGATAQESAALWAACSSTGLKGSGRIRRTLKAVIGSVPDSRYATAAEFVQSTRQAIPRLVKLPAGQVITAESLYVDWCGESSKKDVAAGLFTKPGDPLPPLAPGVYLGWAISAGRMSKLLGSLEKGAVDHVFWLWQPE